MLVRHFRGGTSPCILILCAPARCPSGMLTPSIQQSVNKKFYGLYFRHSPFASKVEGFGAAAPDACRGWRLHSRAADEITFQIVSALLLPSNQALLLVCTEKAVSWQCVLPKALRRVSVPIRLCPISNSVYTAVVLLAS